MKKIYAFEPLIFIFFGLFHIHRIWGLIDRVSYADFWLDVMYKRGAVYYILMAVLAVSCVAGIAVFIKNRCNNYWWRWVYVFCGGYVLCDLFFISISFGPWLELIKAMFDIGAPYWNILWGGFVALGVLSLALGAYIYYLYRSGKKHVIRA